ncbi:MFS transporter [Sphaerimonospora mesophila]|uniref:MFS transporter n=1 Tax=Sphaerimonospora mesophila TaxID=37483 RepID=UPI0007C7B0D5
MGGFGRIGVLVVANLLGGVGVASGVAVGALLIEQVGGTTMAGLGSAANVLGAAIAAVPLATVASRYGRRWSLTLGYVISVVGGALIIAAAVLSNIVVMLAALALFGVAQAVNLQTRYAAVDDTPPATQARAMSTVIWATTVGSVAGPNLSEVGDRLGIRLGLPELSGPYLFSVLSFALAAAVVALLFRPAVRPQAAAAARAARAPGSVGAGSGPAETGRTETGQTEIGRTEAGRTVGALAALRWAAAHPVARFAVVLIATAHAVMITVMVMTPLHLQHHGMTLQVVGLVISLHIMGMYAFSPIFGWLADRFGAMRVAFGGIVMLSVALVLGFLAATLPAGGTLTAVALTILGAGWSASLISASVLLANTSSARVRVPLQGVTDAGMSYAGAAAAALAGPILALGGFRAVNIAAAIILVPAVPAGIAALRRWDSGRRGSDAADAAPEGPLDEGERQDAASPH